MPPNASDAVRFEKRVAIDAPGVVAADALSAASGLSKSQVKQAMTKGAVWLSRGAKPRRLRRAKTRLGPGDVLDLYYDARVLAAEPPAPELVADEGAYTVWYKPFGLLSQGSKWGDHCAITRCAEKRLTPQRPALVVHRIDRAATGLMVVAHDKRAAAALSRLFHDRAVEKGYRAVAQGRVSGEAAPLVIDTPVGGRDARTEVRVLTYDAAQDRSLLDISIDTGRKHQIRVHLASIGCPIVGDRLYGGGSRAAGGGVDREDLQLAAYLLAFTCPLTGEARRYRLPEERLPRLDRQLAAST